MNPYDRRPLEIDGSVALSVRGTLLITLEDGREVIVEVHPLDLDIRDRSNKGEVAFGVEYLEMRETDAHDWLRHAIDQGPPYLTLNGRLRGLDDTLYTIRIPKGAS